MNLHKAKWTRLAGLLALLALALHGAGALGASESGQLQQQCALCLFLFVLLAHSHLPHGALPTLLEAGRVTPQPVFATVATLPRQYPSRGPPA